MAYNSKYTGAELEKKLDAVNDIPNLIDAILLNKNYITEEALKCFMKDYAPSDYSNIPIDNNTIYWENGLLKSKGGTGGGSDNCGCLWELRESKTGGYYLYSKYHVASKYGMSMYIEEATSEDGSGFIPDYVADLPIDNDTIYWSVNSLGNPVLKAKVGTGGSEGNNSEFSKLFKGHYDEAGNLIYIEALSDMIVNGGITIYAGNNIDVDSIYDGLPIDNTTIKWIETTNSDGSIIKLLGINPDIDLGGASTWDELIGKPSWITTNKPKWSYDEDIIGKPDLSVYAKSTEVEELLKKYVTLDTDETINGLKNFAKGLQIGGLGITKSQDDVIYLDANLVVRGGITMYAEGEINVPSIIDSLPIASTTAKGIASFDGTYFAVDSNGKVTLLASNVGLNEEELAAYLTEKKYATQSWVYSLGYASSSDLNALQTKVNDFLEGSDTDTIINKWKELESFLSGLSESDNLATILGTKANQSDLDDTNDVVATKWTQDDTKINNWDNAYKWGNHADAGYALKSYVDNEFKKYVTLADNQTISGVKTFTNGLKIGTSTINQSQSDVVYIDANLVVRGGITMYSDNTVDVGTIFDALPIDGNTIYWENGVLKANVTEGVITNITSAMVVEALGYTPYNASNPKGYISGITSDMVTSALGYTPLKDHQIIYALTIQKNGTNIGTYTPNSAKKTINIVVPTKVSELDNDEEYATTSDLDSRIDALINGAPTAFDTLKEIADVLQGNVNSIGDIITTLGTKADKATTLAGYGITDAYTKVEANALYDKYLLLTGGTLSGDLILKSSTTSGNTPKIIFQRGTTSDNYYDSYIYNTGGSVTFGITYHDTNYDRINIGDKFIRSTSNNSYAIGTDELRFSNVYSVLGNYSGEVSMQSANVNGGKITYDSTNKYFKLEGDLLVTGGVTMYASDSAFTPSTIMDAIATDNVNLKVVNRVLTFVGQTGGGVADSVLWDNIEGKPSWIGSSKPSYSYSEISGTPTLLSSFIDDVVAGKYLPLSGGALSGRLNINQTSSDQPLTLRSGEADSAGACRIQFKDSSNTHQAYVMSGWGELILAHRTGNQIGVGTIGIWCSSNHGSTKNAIYHTGNFNPSDYLLASNYTASDILAKLLTVDGAGSGLDADLLDGLQPSELSVRSASKLTTARTIWGQSFDGTADISGDLKVGDGYIILNNNKSLRVHPTSGESIEAIRLTSSNTFIIGKGASTKGYNTYLEGGSIRLRYGTSASTGLMLNSAGNVLIGTTTDSGYKLDVAGDIRSTTNVRAPIATIDGIPIYKSQDDVLYIDGNLAVRGGVTMYATDAIDVDSVIKALPIASNSVKGIAAFNPNDFSVVDGYVSFIGKGGVDESVLADYAKKTDLSAYLPLSGGQMTGSIGYTLTPDSYEVGLSAAGTIDSLAGLDKLNSYKSFLGSVYTDDWYYALSIRHRNGRDDGNKYGLLLYTTFSKSGNLEWNRQENGIWKGNRVILDSHNWSQFVTAGDGGNYLPLSGGTVYGLLDVTGSFRVSGVLNAEIYRTDGSAPGLFFRSSTWGDKGAYLGATLVDGTAFPNWYNQSGIGGRLVCYFNDTIPMDLNVKGFVRASGAFRGNYGDGSAQYVSLHENGNIYIKTINEIYLQNNTTIQGDMLTEGGITMYSDIRKKTKLQEVELTLQQIADAPLIEHYYKSDAMRTTHVGSIAQYWAGLNDWFCKLDSDGYYTMEIQNAALASAISIARELVKYESKTDRKIRLLKERVKELEEKIEKLENN